MGMTMSMGYRYEDPEDFTYIISEAKNIKDLISLFRKHHNRAPKTFLVKDSKSFDELVLEQELKIEPMLGVLPTRRFFDSNEDYIAHREREKSEYDRKIRELKRRIEIKKGIRSIPSDPENPDKKIYTFHRFDGEIPDIKIRRTRYVDIKRGWDISKNLYVESESEVEACKSLFSNFNEINTGGLVYRVEVYKIDLELLSDDSFCSHSYTP